MRTEDGYIISKCLNGNPAAFGFLIDKYKAAVFAFAYAELRNFHDAEDVTQEAFIKAYQKLRTLRRWDNFLAWLYSITSNLCKMWIRTRLRRPDREFIEDQEPQTLEEPSTDSRRENPMLEILDDALDSLPETYRKVLTLYYLGGMNSREIARFLGTSPAAIRHRLTRARSQLKKGMLAMMSETFEAQRLHAGFTFRMVEAIKHIKIQPMPRAAGLPWGLSLATGIIITILSLGAHLSILNPLATSAGVPLLVEAKALKIGEIPVDVMKVSEIPFITNKQGNGDRGKPKTQNSALITAHGEGGTWTRKADMPTPRGVACSSVVNGKIYVIGGGETFSAPLAVVEEYDPKIDTWTKKTDMPTARGGLTASEVDGKIYAIGGGKGLTTYSVVEEYDPKTDKWMRRADMPTARAILSSSVVNGKIYAIGGVLGVPLVDLSTVEEYDPSTDTWTKKREMPTAREGVSTCVVNGKIYAMGGTLNGQGFTTAVEEYDPNTDTWTAKEDMPMARHYFSVNAVNGKIYAIGGIDENSQKLSSVDVYDPKTDTWSAGVDMPETRTQFCASVVGGHIYVIGGMEKHIWLLHQEDKGLSIVEAYDTGFVPPESIDARGKHTATWGKIKDY